MTHPTEMFNFILHVFPYMRCVTPYFFSSKGEGHPVTTHRRQGRGEYRYSQLPLLVSWLGEA
jgi:hypothetical protein